MHLQQCFAYLGYKPGAFPESERASKEVLSLPVYPELPQAQQDEVIEAVRSFFGTLMQRAAALALALALVALSLRRLARSRNTRSSDFRSPIQRTRSSMV